MLGFPDKNGKKIYEGDFVRYGKGKELKIITFGLFEISCCGCCYHSHQAVGFNFLENEEIDFNEIEVVCNIYEHPNLKGEEE